MSKRMLLARTLRHTGLLRLLELLPSRPGILIVNHHRIGEAKESRFDRGVFSQTEDGLSEQIKLIGKRMPIVAGEELESLVQGKTKLTHMHAAITFDDGYLDNFTKAVPVLQSHNCTAIFFLVTQYVGTATIPWWDEIAFLIRETTSASVTIRTPQPLTVQIGADREIAIHTLLQHYKRQDNVDGEAFLRELREQTRCVVPSVARRFLSWEEARTIHRQGMTIGSHTCSHPVLSQLTPERQQWELTESKAELEAQLQTPIRTLAYPVGTPGAFSLQTEAIARSAGYSMAFAFSGGVNRSGTLRPMHLNRSSMEAGSLSFRTDLALLAAAGTLPY